MFMDHKEENIPNYDIPMGILFDNINFYKNEDIEKFINNLTYEQALYCLIQAAQSAYKRNAYSLLESELLSKALRKISTPDIQEN
jgi:hypothetical protein